MMDEGMEKDHESEALKQLLALVRKSMGSEEGGVDKIAELLKGIEGDQAGMGVEGEEGLEEKPDMMAELGSSEPAPEVEEGLEESGDEAMDVKPGLKQEIGDFFSGKQSKPITPKKGLRAGITEISVGPMKSGKFGKKLKM